MSLETVEMIMEFERQFEIEIPDIEAEKMATLKNVSDYVFKIKFIDQIDSDIREKLNSDVITYLKKELPADFVIEQKTPIYLFFPFKNREQLWLQFQKDLNLQLPQLEKTDLQDWENQKSTFLKLIKPKLRPPLTSYNFSVFFHWVLMLNYERFITVSQRINNREVENEVIRITSESLSIPINEIKLEHSFTSDLGID